MVVVAQGATLDNCLASVGAQTCSDQLEVVLVDVRAGDQQGLPAPAGTRVRVVSAPGSTIAEGRNLGLLAARGDAVMLLDESSCLAPGVVAALLARSKSGQVAVAVPSGSSAGTSADLLGRALDSVDGKLVAGDLARSVRYSDGPRAEIGYWLELSERTGSTFTAVPVAGYDVSAGAEGNDLEDRLDLIAALQRHRSDQPYLASLIEHAVLVEATAVRELLVQDPTRHDDVVRGARERDLELPWSVVNRGLARDLALLYCFVPFIDTSGLVAARRLREWGVVTDVVSQDLSNVARVDEMSMRIPAEVLDEARILPGKRHASQWGSVRGFVEGALAEVADLEAAKGPYRSVYSRAMAPASHVAAAILKLRDPGKRWVAEFSDPLLMNAYGEIRFGPVEQDWVLDELAAGFARAGFAAPEGEPLFGWAEAVAYAFADEIIFTNQHQLDFMLGYCADRGLSERASGISRALHHPVPGESMYRVAKSGYPLAEGVVNIGYFGNFYPNRGLGEIVEALDSLTVAERDRVRLHVFTGRFAALRNEMIERGMADVMRVNPMLGYLEYLNLLTRFDVLMINDYATSPHYVPNPYLPAKLADYLGSGSRIWSLYEPGSVLSTTAVDHASALGDAAAATDVLRQLLKS